MTRNLDYAFDEYLKANAAQAVNAIEDFPRKLEKTCFRYSKFVIPTFYKMHFANSRQEAILKRVGSTLSQIINTTIRLYFEEGHLSHVFKIRPEASELIKIDPGFSQSVVFCRFDALLEGESMKIVELNCDSPAGAGYTDELEDVLLKEKFLEAFVKDHHLKQATRVQGILDALLAVYEEFGGYETPDIAIVDWRNVRTMPEFEYIKRYFESKGYKTTIADPRELKYRGGVLYHKNFKIRLILRRVAFDELLERLDEVEDLIKAYRDGAVCMVNPLRARIAASKALFSILTNPEYNHFFTENENKIKRQHLPWTRRVIDAEHFYGGRKMYLIDFLKDQKESLILKPSVNYGGKDVTIGKETPDDDWNATMDRAIKSDWVIQEYINVPIMTVPIVINHKLDFAYKKYNFNALVAGGRYLGGFVRLSEESVINVARAGGMIPSVTCESIPERFNE